MELKTFASGGIPAISALRGSGKAAVKRYVQSTK